MLGSKLKFSHWYKEKVLRSALPLVSEGEGFFGRSVNPLPSILSFLSVALCGEVSMVESCKSKRRQKEVLEPTKLSTLERKCSFRPGKGHSTNTLEALKST